MKKLLGALFLIFICNNINAQLLWKVSGNGLEKPSYLFGTHHLAPLSILEDITGYKSAFDASTRIVGEVVMSDIQTPSAMQVMQKSMMIADETTFKSLFTPEEYSMVEKSLKEILKMDVNQMPKIKPAFISNNLTVALFIKHNSNYNPQQQLDGHFQIKGKEAGKKIAGLETIEFQFNLLFNDTPLKRQAEQLTCLLSDTEKVVNSLERMTTAYMKQNLNEVKKITEEKDGTICDPLPGEMERINDKRNISWMKKIPSMLKEESNFIAVGALHLLGDNGLINLLKKAGYKVEPVK